MAASQAWPQTCSQTRFPENATCPAQLPRHFGGAFTVVMNSDFLRVENWITALHLVFITHPNTSTYTHMSLMLGIPTCCPLSTLSGIQKRKKDASSLHPSPPPSLHPSLPPPLYHSPHKHAQYLIAVCQINRRGDQLNEENQNQWGKSDDPHLHLWNQTFVGRPWYLANTELGSDETTWCNASLMFRLLNYPPSTIAEKQINEN